MAQKRTPSRAQRRTPRVRCFVSVAAMQQSAHSIAAARPASAPRAALPLCLQMRKPELPEHSLASPLSFPRSLVLRALRNAAAMVAAASSRFGRSCSFVSSLPPPKLTAPSPSSHHAAPLDLLYRRLWPLMLPAVGAATVAAVSLRAAEPHAHVASRPRSTSGRAEASSGCVRAPWCSPAPQPPTTCLLRPDSASSDDLPVQNPVRDLLLEFDEVQGPNCEVSDSCE